ncbi:hypothetical protein D9M70_377160 [compost metagenome]
MGDLEHGLRDALEHLHQGLAGLRRQVRQAEAEEHREEDDRQHLATGHRGEDVGGDQVEQGRDQRMVVLHFLGGLLVLGDVHRAQGAHVDAGAGLEEVGQQQADHDRHRGDDLEVEDGLQADAAELLGVAHAGDADDERGDDDRDDDHLDQADEDITGRLQDVGDPPGLLGAEMVEQGANGDTQHQPDENLPREAQSGLGHSRHPLISFGSREYGSVRDGRANRKRGAMIHRELMIV